MGQCGCGEFHTRKAFQVGEDCFVAVDQYRACAYCGTPHAYRLFFFDRKGADYWLDGAEIIQVVPSEYGEEHWLPFIGAEDLEAAAREMQFSDELECEAGPLLQRAIEHRERADQETLERLKAREAKGNPDE